MSGTGCLGFGRYEYSVHDLRQISSLSVHDGCGCDKQRPGSAAGNCSVLCAGCLYQRSQGNGGCDCAYGHEYCGAVRDSYFVDCFCGSSFSGSLSHHFVLPRFMGSDGSDVHSLLWISAQKDGVPERIG